MRIKRRKKCEFCQAYVEIGDTGHKCSERRIKRLEQKYLLEAQQEQESFINPDRTYDDRLQEAELMMHPVYGNNLKDGIHLGLYTVLSYARN